MHMCTATLCADHKELLVKNSSELVIILAMLCNSKTYNMLIKGTMVTSCAQHKRRTCKTCAGHKQRWEFAVAARSLVRK
jgi:hypothetical protein